jgi:Xaa-Pro aminopeptidase
LKKNSKRQMELERIVSVRKKKALEFVKENGLDALVLSRLDNARFVSGLRPVLSPWLVSSYWALLTADGRLTLLVPSGDSGRMKKTLPWVQSVVQLHSSRGMEIVAGALRETSSASGKVGYDSLESMQINKLKGLMQKIELRPVGGELLEVRAKKAAEEVEVMRSGAKVTEKALATAVETAREGMKECELSAKAEAVARSMGAEGVSWSFATFSGDHAGLMYRHDTEKPLRNGEFLILGFATVCDGYNTDITATTVVGERPSSEQKKVYSAVYESYRVATSMVRPGVATKSMSENAARVLRDAGFAYENSFESFQPLIHGLGMNVYEPPFSPEPGEEGPSTDLDFGHVLAVEPTVASFDDPTKGGVRMGETILVTANGHEVLGKMPGRSASVFSMR